MTPEAQLLADECKRLARKFAGHSALPIATAILQGKYDATNEQVGIPITQELVDLDDAIDRLASLIPAGGLAEEASDMTEQKPQEAWIPRDPAEVRKFIGSHCRLLTYGEPSEPTIALENDTYELTAHDLLSAFVWAGHFDGDDAMAASTPQGQEKTR